MPSNTPPHQEMVTKSAGMRQVLTADLYAYLISLLPTPQIYGELHDRFESSFTGYLKGDPEKMKECEEACQELALAMAIINGLGRAVSHKDPKVLDILGINHAAEKNSSASAVLGAPKDFRVIFDKKGRPYCTLTKLSGAKGYEIWTCEAEPSIESNWRLLVWSPSCQNIHLEGVDRTKTNYLKTRGKSSNSAGPWSDVVILESV